MNNKYNMSFDDIMKYLKGAMDAELDVLVQKNTLKAMRKTYNSLGKHEKIYMPTQKSSEVSFLECAEVSAGAGAILGAVIGFFSTDGFISGIIEGFFAAIGGYIIGGTIFGVLSYVVIKAYKYSQNKAEFENNLSIYGRELKKDNDRVAVELKKKDALEVEIKAMEESLSKAERFLQEIYSYNVIKPDYQNLSAVCSFYGYFDEGRTQSFAFDANTGDQGAYNIYKNEILLKQIVSNTEIIIERLEEISNVQYILKEELRKVNKTVNHLCSSVNTQLAQISDRVDSIDRSQSVIEYNTNRAAAQLEFSNWMRYM